MWSTQAEVLKWTFLILISFVFQTCVYFYDSSTYSQLSYFSLDMHQQCSKRHFLKKLESTFELGNIVYYKFPWSWHLKIVLGAISFSRHWMIKEFKEACYRITGLDKADKNSWLKSSNMHVCLCYLWEAYIIQCYSCILLRPSQSTNLESLKCPTYSGSLQFCSQ